MPEPKLRPEIVAAKPKQESQELIEARSALVGIGTLIENVHRAIARKYSYAKNRDEYDPSFSKLVYGPFLEHLREKDKKLISYLGAIHRSIIKIESGGENEQTANTLSDLKADIELIKSAYEEIFETIKDESPYPNLESKEMPAMPKSDEVIILFEKKGGIYTA